MWEKEKMLVTSIFSFFHNVFYPSKNKFQFFIHIHFVVCKIYAFDLDQSKIESFGKELKLSLRTEWKILSAEKTELLSRWAIPKHLQITN